MNLRPTTIPNDVVWMCRDVPEKLMILKTLVDRYIQYFEVYKGHSRVILEGRAGVEVFFSCVPIWIIVYRRIKSCDRVVTLWILKKKDLQHLAVSPCYCWRARNDSNVRPTDS